MLEAVGLTPIEEQVYRLLVRAGSMSAAELCQQLALPSEKADAVFSSLAAKGLITSTTTGPSMRFIAAPVAVAGEALLHRRFEELQAARLEFAKIAEEYCAAGSRPAIGEMIEIVPREAVPTLFEQFQRNAKSEVWTITMPPYAVPADKNAVEIERLACGVSYLALYTRAALEEPGAMEMIRHYVEAGEQARMQPGLAAKMAIFDGEVALMPAGRWHPLAGAPDSLVVHPSALLDALVELFERLWLSAVPLDSLVSGGGFGDRSRPDGGWQVISAWESRLLVMLLAGMTDDAIGHQLGLSRRTVVRRIHQLMAYAKATNRLQLILRAVQLGWIDLTRRAPGPAPGRAHEPPAAPNMQALASRRRAGLAATAAASDPAGRPSLVWPYR
jgi:DNA-binding CsgD family transcriptional regulator/DNA-binding MarR family transcriptional regulator